MGDPDSDQGSLESMLPDQVNLTRVCHSIYRPLQMLVTSKEESLFLAGSLKEMSTRPRLQWLTDNLVLLFSSIGANSGLHRDPEPSRPS